MEMREERGHVESRVSCLTYNSLFFKMKYLENRNSKLGSVFTFENLASTSSKLDPTLIDFGINT
jgi:hypothetical protein